MAVLHLRGLYCVLGLALASLLLPPSTQACFPAGCPEAHFIPRSGAAIPSNAPALVYKTSWLDSDPKLRLVRIDESPQAEVPITLEALGDDSFLMLSEKYRQSRLSNAVLIRPAELVAGARYRLERVDARCQNELSEFDVTEPAELPHEIGELILGPAKQDCVRLPGGAGCYSSVPATLVELELSFNETALPWSDLLQIRYLVDDQLWTPLWDLKALPPPQGRSHELLYVDCRTRDSARLGESPIYMPEPGKHRVRVEVRLFGTSLEMRSVERHTSLACDDTSLTSVDTLPDACRRPPLDPREPFAEPVQAQPDTPQEKDAHEEDAHEEDARAKAQPEAPPASCHVSAPGSTRSSSLQLVALAAVAWWYTRRRPRR